MGDTPSRVVVRRTLSVVRRPPSGELTRAPTAPEPVQSDATNIVTFVQGGPRSPKVGSGWCCWGGRGGEGERRRLASLEVLQLQCTNKVFEFPIILVVQKP